MQCTILQSNAATKRRYSSVTMDADFAGAKTYFTHDKKILLASEMERIPCYRLMGPNGVILNEKDDPKLPDGG